MKTNKMVISHYFYRRAGSLVHIKLIIALENGEMGIRELSKNIKMTYVNLTQVLQDMEKEELIVRNKKDNEFRIEFTEKGRMLCELIKGVQCVIDRWDEEETPKFIKKLNL